ncbi:hypothetical protein MARBORIA2_04470 [Methanobrevibacter arboriphilus]|jgi:hypothetical protein|uniref:Uncharacterized protein n=1 Tax=Methanobrevibacter arboriphilus TaxID=39441 RepID=A0ACA8R271_METAZ|nr:hypothetical protein MarbSA_03490 [Methanobrevibacter arboriphilus]GLI11357.1 hypothetical protein MARBORIA2_04470 [Methanobrevibacter arboriphilus]
MLEQYNKIYFLIIHKVRMKIIKNNKIIKNKDIIKNKGIIENKNIKKRIILK